MEILVAILAIALLAAIAFAVVQHRRGAATTTTAGRTGSSPLPRSAARSNHPMAEAVHEHAQAVEPHEAAVAEQRLQARAGQVAAGLQADAHRSAAAEHQRAADAYADPTSAGTAYGAGTPGATGYDPASSANHPDPHADGAIDPVTGERVDGYGDPANDPRYDDPRYDGRLAADYDPQRDERIR